MFSFIRILFQIAWQVAVNYFYYRQYFKHSFQNYLYKSDGTLTAKDIKRMKFFAIFIPVMLGDGFSLLREKKMSVDERIMMMSFSAATPLFDDFFDDNNLSVQHLEQLFIEQDKYQPKNSKEQIFIEILLSLQPTIHQPEKFIALCLAIFNAQKAALAQVSNKNISWDELKQISLAKCSASAVLFWSLLKDDDTSAEKMVVRQVGNLIQYTDDVFDLWFDLQEGTQTVATNAKSIVLLENDFKAEWKKLLVAVGQLPINHFNQQKFIKLQWFFFSRTFVALEQLKKLPFAHDDFNPLSFTRQQLVCDMEKWRNRIKWVRYFSGGNDAIK